MNVIRTALAAVAALALLAILCLGAITFQLNRTLLNADFAYEAVLQADVIGITESKLPELIPPDARDLILPAVKATLAEQRSLLLQQVKNALDSTYRFVRGEDTQLVLTIEAEPLLRNFLYNLRRQLEQSPPPELKEMPAEARGPAIDEMIASIEKELRGKTRKGAALTIPLTELPPEVQQSVYRYQGYVQSILTAGTVFLWLGVILTGLVFWLGSLRWVAVVFGAAALGAFALQLIEAKITWMLVPAAVKTTLPPPALGQIPLILDRAAGPLGTVALGFLGIGGLAFGLSFIRRKQPQTAAAAVPAAAVTAQPTAPVSAEPPAPTPAIPAPASQASRPALAPRKIWAIAGAAVVVLIGAGLWLGDAKGRYHASNWHKFSQTSFLKSDWNATLSAAKQAVLARPTDLGYRREFESRQDQWVKLIGSQITGDAPFEDYGKLSGEPAKLGKLLTEPYAAKFRALIDENLEEVREELETRLQEAEALAAEGKAAEAKVIVDKIRPFAATYDKFEAGANKVRIAVVHEAISRAGDKAMEHDFPRAFEILESVRADSKLAGNEYFDAEASFRIAQFNNGLGAAVAIAEEGEWEKAADMLDEMPVMLKSMNASEGFSAAVDRLLAAESDVREREKSRPENRLKAMQAEVKSVAARQFAVKLPVAIRAGNAADTQALLDRYAKVAKLTVKVDAAELMREKDFTQFVALLTRLGIHAANEKDRQSSADVIIVENLRTYFGTTTELNDFVSRGFLAWARELAEQDRLGSALYLLYFSRRIGEHADVELEKKTLDRLHKIMSGKILFPPTKSESGSADWAAGSRNALRGVFSGPINKWMTVAEDPNDESQTQIALTLETSVTNLQTTKATTTRNQTVRYQEGTATSANPAYERAQREVESAQRDYDKAIRDKASAERTAAASDDGGGFGALLTLTSGAVSAASVAKAENALTDARRRLGSTPATLTAPAFYNGQVQIHSHAMAHTVKYTAKFMDGTKPLFSQVWSTEIKYTTEESAPNPRMNYAGIAPKYMNDNDVRTQIEQSIAKQIAEGKNDMIQRLANSMFDDFNKHMSEVSPTEAGDIGWMLVSLWQEVGVRPPDYPEWVKRIGTALGLPFNSAASVLSK